MMNRIFLATVLSSPLSWGYQVVAEVNGEKILYSDLEAEIKPQLAIIEDQIRRLKEAVLSRMIDNALIRQAARAEQQSIESFVNKRIAIPEITKAEIDAEFQRSKDRFSGAIEPEIKYRIRRTLEDSRRASAFRSLIEELRARGNVRNLLMEPSTGDLDLAARSSSKYLGASDAPVAIVEFLDYQCSFCRAAHKEVMKLVQRHNGTVRYTIRHFPLSRHARAFEAARASVCAEGSADYWNYHEGLFREGGLDRDELVRLAVATGMERDKFESCLLSPESEQRVARDVELGKRLGVDRTPYFFVNRRRAFSAQELVGAIGAELNALSGQAERVR
jgi:protein-disulfide isomerase